MVNERTIKPYTRPTVIIYYSVNANYCNRVDNSVGNEVTVNHYNWKGESVNAGNGRDLNDYNSVHSNVNNNACNDVNINDRDDCD